MAEKPYIPSKSPNGGFVLMGRTYVAPWSVVAFEIAGDETTLLFLEGGHRLVVDLAAHKVRNIMETK